jgi:anti-sigma regulatory factor (Ser/Thr protein kinase)
VIGRSELRIVRSADPTAPRELRHALRAFLDVFALNPDFLEDVLLAVGEVLANSVEHAYDDPSHNHIEMLARFGENGTLAIDVYDEGRFIERERLPDRGFGLRIVRSIARNVTIETGHGTRVQMTFDAARLQAAR